MTDTSTLVAGNGTDPAIKDFSTGKKPKQFRIDDDVFTCAAAIPVGLVRKFIKLRATPVDGDDPGQVEDQLQKVMEILDDIMFEDSIKRFAERMDSKTEPIDMATLTGVMNWLMEEYGERPTVPSSSSSPPQEPTTPISMDGAPREESIPTPSISVAI